MRSLDVTLWQARQPLLALLLELSLMFTVVSSQRQEHHFNDHILNLTEAHFTQLKNTELLTQY